MVQPLWKTAWQFLPNYTYQYHLTQQSRSLCPHKNLHTNVYRCFIHNFDIYLFIYGCVGSSLLRAGVLQLQQAGASLRCGARASHCGGFSCCGAPALGTWASVVAACGLSSCGSQALERRLSSCGAWAQLLRGMWDLPGPGLEPVSPTLAGRFLTIAPPGKSTLFIIAKTWKQPRCLLTGEWIKKRWYVRTVQCYSALERKVLSNREKTWRDLQCVLLSERS